MSLDYYWFFLRKLVWFGMIWVSVPKIDLWGIFPTQFSSLSWDLLVKVPFWAKTMVPYESQKREKIHISYIVHPRKISLTESRGSSSFLYQKVVSIFHFEPVWISLIYYGQLWVNFPAKGGGLWFWWHLFPIHF